MNAPVQSAEDFKPKLVTKDGQTLSSFIPGSVGLKGGSGGGTLGGMPPDFPERIATLEANTKNMAASVDRIDNSVGKIRDRMDADFRITWGGLIAIALGLAALMAKGFKWI